MMMKNGNNVIKLKLLKSLSLTKPAANIYSSLNIEQANKSWIAS